MKDIMIRTMTLEDLDHYLDLRETVASEARFIGAEAPIDRAGDRDKTVASYVTAGDGCMFVAIFGDRLVGASGVNVHQGIADLGMNIAPEWRGRGIGSALIEASIDWARAQAAHKISLQVWPHNDTAIALYEKYGFVREGYLRRHWRRRNGELWDAVIMGLHLDQGLADGGA